MFHSLTLVALGSVAGAQPPADPFARWEKEITAIETRLKEKPPAKGGVVFAGSSSVRLWTLDAAFPDLNAVNLGFGGSEVRDSTHFAPRILLPLEPRAVVFYAGDNDVAKGRTPEQVRDDFKAFAAAVHAKLPKTTILYVPIKPSLKRWEQFPQQSAANAMIRAVCAADRRLRYVDIVPAMLGPGGGPPPADLFVKDGLHLSEKGYAIWNAAVKKELDR